MDDSIFVFFDSYPDIPYSWSCYDTVEDVQALLESLATQGIRESALKKSLCEKMTCITDGIKRFVKLIVWNPSDAIELTYLKLFTTHGTKKISATTFVYKAVLCFVVTLLQDNYFSGFSGILSFLKKLGLCDNP